MKQPGISETSKGALIKAMKSSKKTTLTSRKDSRKRRKRKKVKRAIDATATNKNSLVYEPAEGNDGNRESGAIEQVAVADQ
jgi:hypothetical protein